MQAVGEREKTLGGYSLKKPCKWVQQVHDLADIVEREGEISEINLLLRSGLSLWTFQKIKPYFLKLNPKIQYNNKLNVFYFIRLENSLSLLSPTEREELK